MLQGQIADKVAPSRERPNSDGSAERPHSKQSGNGTTVGEPQINYTTNGPAPAVASNDQATSVEATPRPEEPKAAHRQRLSRTPHNEERDHG